MAANIPETEPSEVVAGDTARWLKALSDYPPSDGWALSYALVVSGVRLTIAASDYGDGRHYVNVAAATTAAWAVGIYDWQAYVTHSGTGERYTVGSGILQVQPGFAAAASGYDGRSHARRMLDAIEASLEGRADAGQLELIGQVLGDRSVTRNPEILLPWRDRYRAEVQSELAAAGISVGGTIAVRV